MTRICLLAVVLTACGAGPDVGQEPDETSPPPIAPPELTEAPLPRVAPPKLTEAPPAPVLLAPPAPTSNAPAGMHESASGACYLPDIIRAGDCRCPVYDNGQLVVPGDNLCFDSCAYNADGIAEMHGFCVDGGLPADLHPR